MDKSVILASQCGASLGKYILTIEKNSVDPNYSRKVQNNELRTSQQINLYSIKPIKVKMAQEVESAEGTKFVEYNGDSKLRLQISGINDIADIIPKPNAESVKNAITRFESTGEITIFIDYPQLTIEIVALNMESRAKLTAFVNEQMRFIKTFETANETEIAACKTAMAAEGIEINNYFG